MMNSELNPRLLAGPILRRVERDKVSIWIALSQSLDIRLEFSYHSVIKDTVISFTRSKDNHFFTVLQSGKFLYYYLIDIQFKKPLPVDVRIDYQLYFGPDNESDNFLSHYPELAYPGETTFSFYVASRLKQVLHGSCRNPYSDSPDALVFADQAISRVIKSEVTERPSLLLFSGDQIYADHVAGPMLSAIHQAIELLGLPDEDITIFNLPELTTSRAFHKFNSYYQRDKILPTQTENSLFFSGKRKPIFTSIYADNHLITLAEYLVVYLLVWSPSLWELISLDPPDELSDENLVRYKQEIPKIKTFIDGLKSAQRLMAHIPVAMIFDDHDISDDWNLHRAWEEAAYSHPYSNRIISNGIIAYLINQGWSNCPEVFEPQRVDIENAVSKPGNEAHERLSKHLLKFERWGYVWDTQPKLVVLDTRTQRWRSEKSAYHPSGLLDWEGLTDLQEHLKGLSSVILVSAPPIFGVKLIEVIQRVFTIIGKPLMVDSENWMAHPGSGNGILNIFRHRRTPENFTILSGDVHYSFVYDVRLKSDDDGPKIWQICSSGIKNTFPTKLLIFLDHLNRILYASRSPLNWFTKRRRLRISPRKPKGLPHGRRLLNKGGIGLVEFDQEGKPTRISQLIGDNQSVEFSQRLNESVWH